MTIEIDDVRSLADWIKSTNARTVFLDGDCDSGKSTLAKKLSRFGFVTKDVDEFVTPKTDCYVKSLRIDELKDELSKIPPESTTIISGICARDVANKLQIGNAKFVYVVRVRIKEGIIRDEYSPAHEVELGNEVTSELVPKDGAAKEVYEYHKRVRPRGHADVELKNMILE